MTAEFDLLRDLVLAPGPSGFEEPVQEVVRARVGAVAPPATDVLGNVTATVNPGATPSVVVAAHADQIGLQVTWVDPAGFVYFDKLGGVDPLLLPGRAMVIHAKDGPVLGVVGKRPTHMIPEAERGKAADLKDQWIDIGAADHDAALARVSGGDAITFAPHFVELAPGIVAGRALDDRCGLWVACRALELYARAGGAASLTLLSTVQEETRYMGAAAYSRSQRPDCLFVVDGDFATDQPEVDAKKGRGVVELGKGPVIARGSCSHKRLFALACAVAEAEGIPYQVKAYVSPTQTDADELQVWPDVANLNLAVPMRYMHSPFEVVRGQDAEWTAALVAALVRRLGEVYEPGLFTTP